MYKFLLTSLILSTASISLTAAKISPDTAKGIADKFLSSHFFTRAHLDSSNLQFDNYKNTIYVINNPSGGWVLVAADDSLPNQVLGYSPVGHFTTDNLSDGARWMLDEYARGIASINNNSPKIQFASRSDKSVAPLLGEIAWDQYYPYNSLAPEIGEENCLAGCVNIALAQIMRYHKYPQKGSGTHFYNWKDTRLSADFSKAEYQWDLMKPSYTGNESEVEKNAVAQLIYDVAVSNESNFGIAETSASFKIGNFLSYFNYDPGISVVVRNECKANDYESILRAELDKHLPVYVEGGSPGGAHSFVCDGYDSEGYFHYNYGWGASSNGYFLCSATGFDSYPTLTIGIKPNEGGLPGLWGATSDDVYWKENDYISCYFNAVIHSQLKADIEVGFGVEDKTGKVKYFPKDRFDNVDNAQIFGYDFNDKVEDGEYILYPVCRIVSGEWRRVYVGENAADHVELSVKNGIKTYTNKGVGGELEEGVVQIDGIYYEFEDNEAVVTSRNSRGKCYEGNVVIPASVNYNGKEYPVTVIGEAAFKFSRLNKLTIGKNVRLIMTGAFTQCHVDDLVFAEGTQLKEIASFAFNQADIPVLRLPEGLETLGPCAFRGDIKLLDIPSTLKDLPSETFSCNYLYFKDLYVHWKSEETLPSYVESTISTDVSHTTLHVPAGCGDIYRNHELWSKFGTITDKEGDPILAKIDQLYYLIDNEEAIITSPSTRDEGYSGNIVIPATVGYSGKTYPVTAIGEGAFKDSQLSSLKVGKNVSLIETNAFENSEIKDFLFEEGSKLKELSWAAFSFAHIPMLILPEGLEKIGENAFIGWFDTLSIPSTVKNLPSASLSCFSLKDLYVHWKNENDLPFYDQYTINDDVTKATLHVPVGCVQIYQNHEMWSKFGTIKDDQTGVQNVHGGNNKIKIISHDGYISFESADKNVIGYVYSIQGQLLAALQPGVNIFFGKGVFILRTGNKAYKVIM